MRRTLYWKFIFAYLILAILSLLVVTTLGRQLVENSRVRAEADTMYAEASRIAASHGVRYFSVSADLKESYENLQTIAAADETVIRVIATDGREIINTDMPYDPEKPHVIESFNYATFGPGTYEIGTFYDEYEEDCLSVICPVTSGVRVRGYIAITEDLTVIRDDETAKEFPLVMTNGRVPFYHHGTLRNIPRLREMYPAPELWISPEDAAKEAIETGSWVWIESKRGKIRAKALVTKGIKPGTVCMERFWNPETLNTETHGWQEMNVNVLSKSTAPYNDIVGTHTLRAYQVKVTRAEEGPKGVWTKPEDFKSWLPLVK